MSHDALSRIEPTARDLLRRVDGALISHGAPAGHLVWEHLRQLGTTPADAVEFFAGVDPMPLRDAGQALREQANAYADAPVPNRISWLGAAGEAYAAQADALADHVGADRPDAPGAETMCGRLLATASYVDAVADWYAGARLLLAGALADVISSAQAVTLHSCPALAGGVGDLAQLAGQIPAEAVTAAADIGAHVLAAAGTAHAEGQDLLRQWAPALVELPYRAPAVGAARLDAAIDVRP